MEFVIIAILALLVVLGARKWYSLTQTDAGKACQSVSERMDSFALDVSNPLIAALGDFVVLDIETTGLNRNYDEIVQFAAIRYHAYHEVERYCTYVKPRIPISNAASAINGIRNDMLLDAPKWADVSETVQTFLRGNVLVAHNASFDMAFLRQACGVCLPNTVIDTLAYARKCIATENHKLTTLKKFLGLNAKSHSADGDCEVTAALFAYCVHHTPNLNEYFGFACSVQAPHASTSELLLYREVICAALLRKNISLDGISVHDSAGAFYVCIHNMPFFTFKYDGRLKYWSVHVPFPEFNAKHPSNISITPESKSNGGDSATRVFIANANDLKPFDSLIVDEYLLARSTCLWSRFGA